MTNPDLRRDSGQRAARAVYRLLIAGTVGVAGVTFTLSFVGLRDYGVLLMRLPRVLAPLVPLGVDVFSVCGVAATYLLRQAAWRVRMYAWAVFLVPSLLSIAGNLAHADARRLPASGMVGAAVAPVLLALAVHLIVVVRRAMDRDSDQAAVRDSGEVSAAEESGQVTPVESLSPERESGQREQRPHNATPDEVRTAALSRLVAGADIDEVAASAGVTVRTVQRWHDDAVAAIRSRSRRARTARRAGQRPPGAPDSAPPADGGDDEPAPAAVAAMPLYVPAAATTPPVPVNGARPEVQVS